MSDLSLQEEGLRKMVSTTQMKKNVRPLQNFFDLFQAMAQASSFIWKFWALANLGSKFPALASTLSWKFPTHVGSGQA